MTYTETYTQKYRDAHAFAAPTYTFLCLNKHTFSYVSTLITHFLPYAKRQVYIQTPTYAVYEYY